MLIPFDEIYQIFTTYHVFNCLKIHSCILKSRTVLSFGDGSVGVLSTPTVWPDPRSLRDGTVGGVSTMWQEARLLGGGLCGSHCLRVGISSGYNQNP